MIGVLIHFLGLFCSCHDLEEYDTQCRVDEMVHFGENSTGVSWCVCMGCMRYMRNTLCGSVELVVGEGRQREGEN